MVRKVIEFGKIDYYGTGRKANLVTVTMELEEVRFRRGAIGGEWSPMLLKGSKGIQFSVSADVWNHIRSDIFMGGQCLDEIGHVPVNDALFQEIKRLWKKYHLKYTRDIPPKDMARIREIMSGRY